MGLLQKLSGIFSREQAALPAAPEEPAPVSLPVDAVKELLLQQLVGETVASAHQYASRWDGQKFVGGITDNFAYGGTVWTDYYLLRKRSEEIFQRNLYARGLIRRLVTNEIHTGLTLEATPVESVLGFPEEGLLAWSDEVEVRFDLWSRTKGVCDYHKLMTFGELQALVRREAIVGGDCVVIVRQDERTGLPNIQVIPASQIGGEGVGVPDENRVIWGVEVNEAGQHVAYHVFDVNRLDIAPRRVPAMGRNGRRVAWMVYGNDMRTHTYRGEPLLSLVLQSIKEIDKYRDSAQRKALINSLLAIFIRKDADKFGTKPFTNVASAIHEVMGHGRGANTEPRSFDIADLIPGIVMEELQHGETPVGFDNRGVDTSFPVFEEAILAAIAWANQIPLEILRLSFNSNYSASQAALNEFRTYLDLARWSIGNAFCQPLYEEWLASEVTRGGLAAPGFIRSIGDPSQFMEFAAWTNADWSGSIKPTTDPKKAVEAELLAIAGNLRTHAQATRALFGRRFPNNVKTLGREWLAINEMRSEAGLAPQSFGPITLAIGSDNTDQDNDNESDVESDEQEDEVATESE